MIECNLQEITKLSLTNPPLNKKAKHGQYSKVMHYSIKGFGKTSWVVIVNIDLTKDQQRGPSTEDLKELNSLLEKNRNRIERPVPNRKHWPDEGSVSGPNRLMGIDGRDEFANRIEHAKRMNRFLASGGKREL